MGLMMPSVRGESGERRNTRVRSFISSRSSGRPAEWHRKQLSAFLSTIVPISDASEE
jgi:hypothetical protein